MKKIIVATDYSKAATNALHYAASLARETGAGMILFNAFQLPPNDIAAHSYSLGISKLIDNNQSRLEKVAFEITMEYGVHTEAISSISFVAEELNVLADRHRADLIVMGLQDNSAEFGLLGSVTTFMISNTPFPVLVVPEGTPYTGIKEIAFACDYHGLQQDQKLPLLKDFAEALKARVQVLHVEKAREPLAEPKQTKEKDVPDMENILAGIPHSYRDLTDEHILDGIERGVRESNADLLVMIPKHTGFWNMIFNRSKTRKMAKKTHVPLLALPLAEKKEDIQPVMKVYHNREV